jgi:hypothetical protein
MNYYFLPGTGVFGGIKVGFQFSQMLGELGVPIVVVTPEGKAATWFYCTVPVISKAEALTRITDKDVILFSLPHDYSELKATGARLVLHCQGTDPLIDPIIADESVVLLSCWEQAAHYMRERAGRGSIEVGISISRSFFYDGRPKYPIEVAYLPRRGGAIAEAAIRRFPALRFNSIDGASEGETARAMMRCSYYLATSVGEGFGLPALEAMAAGCVVVSVPVVGGVEYLLDGTTAVVVEPTDAPEALVKLASAKSTDRRARLRDAGHAMAHRYTPQRQISRLRKLLGAELRPVLSWT